MPVAAILQRIANLLAVGVAPAGTPATGEGFSALLARSDGGAASEATGKPGKILPHDRQKSAAARIELPPIGNDSAANSDDRVTPEQADIAPTTLPKVPALGPKAISSPVRFAEQPSPELSPEDETPAAEATDKAEDEQASTLIVLSAKLLAPAVTKPGPPAAARPKPHLATSRTVDEPARPVVADTTPAAQPSSAPRTDLPAAALPRHHFSASAAIGHPARPVVAEPASAAETPSAPVDPHPAIAVGLARLGTIGLPPVAPAMRAQSNASSIKPDRAQDGVAAKLEIAASEQAAQAMPVNAALPPVAPQASDAPTATAARDQVAGTEAETLSAPAPTAAHEAVGEEGPHVPESAPPATSAGPRIHGRQARQDQSAQSEHATRRIAARAPGTRHNRPSIGATPLANKPMPEPRIATNIIASGLPIAPAGTSSQPPTPAPEPAEDGSGAAPALKAAGAPTAAAAIATAHLPAASPTPTSQPAPPAPQSGAMSQSRIVADRAAPITPPLPILADSPAPSTNAIRFVARSGQRADARPAPPDRRPIDLPAAADRAGPSIEGDVAPAPSQSAAAPVPARRDAMPFQSTAKLIMAAQPARTDARRAAEAEARPAAALGEAAPADQPPAPLPGLGSDRAPANAAPAPMPALSTHQAAALVETLQLLRNEARSDDLTLAVNHDELGKITMHFDRAEHGVSVRFDSPDPSVTQLIANSASALKSAGDSVGMRFERQDLAGGNTGSSRDAPRQGTGQERAQSLAQFARPSPPRPRGQRDGIFA